MDTSIWAVLLFALVSFLSAGLAYLMLGRVFPGSGDATRLRKLPVFTDVARRYVFREGYLLSEIDPNDVFLDAGIDRTQAYDALCNSLGALHRGVLARFSALETRGEAFVLTFPFGSDELLLSGRRDGDGLVVTVSPSETVPGREAVEVAVLQALRNEADELRQVIDHSPTLVWKQSADGQVFWANATYKAMLAHLEGRPEAAETWPVPRIFDTSGHDFLAPDSPMPAVIETLEGEESAELHYELSALRQADGSYIFSALPAERVNTVEAARDGVVQTLSKTFAMLPIALAVFDRQRELVLFNPALLTVSKLQASFLSNRPSLPDFLDALREGQRMPEPKDYRAWRDTVTDLERSAAEGTYQAIWSLPGGQSLRVFGRPYPDGALALMIEDITAEVSLTRQFRGDLDLYQAVLDEQPRALALFAAEGRMVMHNAKLAALWEGVDVAGQGLSSVLRLWEDAAEPTAFWADIRQVASRQMAVSTEPTPLNLRDGRRLIGRVARLAGGATLVSFEDADPVPQESAPLLGALRASRPSTAAQAEAMDEAKDFVANPNRASAR